MRSTITKGIKTHKIVISWTRRKMMDEGVQSTKIIGMSHPGCCSQGDGCPKKHG